MVVKAVYCAILVAAVLALVAPHQSSAQTTTTGCNPTCVRGTCLQTLNSNTYECNCTGTGYDGPACNDTGSSSPSTASGPSPSGSANSACPGCLNGVCEAQYNSPLYVCTCRAGYSGETCETPVPGSSPASATSAAPATSSGAGCPSCVHGTCRPVFNSNAYDCECNPGYGGLDCSNVQPAGAPGPLAGAPATCSPACARGTCRVQASSGSPVCECPSGYSGHTCSQISPTSSSTDADSDLRATGDIQGWAVFLICLVVIVGVLLLSGTGILLYRRRKQRSTFVKFNDSNFEPQSVEVLGRPPGGSYAA